MKPSSASACLSPRAVVKAREPTLPLCGPGYALLMIGYFFDASKFDGRNIMPYRSVVPSAAFTLTGIGGFHPDAIKRLTSAFSNGITSLPFASRKFTTGGTSGDEYVSIRYWPLGDNCMLWSPTSGVSDTC